jgi:microcystin-dependent protein
VVTQPFLGQIQCFGFGFAPTGWALCQGQLLPISQNAALFSLLGTYYGGNGTSTFALPNLQSRVPVHQGQLTGGSFYSIGEEGGTESVTLNLSQMPLHNHGFLGTTSAANVPEPQNGSTLATTYRRSGGVSPGDPFYAPYDSKTGPINPSSISFVGNNLPHTNIQPFVTVNWCIALRGIYPARN